MYIKARRAAYSYIDTNEKNLSGFFEGAMAIWRQIIGRSLATSQPHFAGYQFNR
ncbi:hypothetical protein SAMN05216421_1562 [Halopseudomonas xinjiangensis]|uniref:Uncharacterized protein n=1 Tax=Halopseudomonas xinjiangensis TaxID=487184 RepID=A0A1H1SDA3_9GAMM|nr:hypothetical protein SAMN05216421_1562 [Halopseudomonas xinjiangensis]